MANRAFPFFLRLSPLFLAFAVAACGGNSYPYATQPAGPLSARAQNEIADMDSKALSRIGRSFELAGDMNSAMNMYKRAAALDPADTLALVGMGNIFSALGAAGQAEEQYNKALAIAPANKEAMAGLAKVRIAEGRAEEAKQLLVNYMTAHGADAAIYNYLGVAHDLLGEHDAAQLVYAKGLDTASDNSAILNNMALSFAVAGHYETAIGLLQQNLNNPAIQSGARQNLALVYALSGDLETAVDIAGTELSEEDVNVNRPFYARLAALNNRDRARAVFLGTLPALAEEPAQQATVDPNPVAIGPDQKRREAQQIARHVVEVTREAAETPPVIAPPVQVTPEQDGQETVLAMADLSDEVMPEPSAAEIFTPPATVPAPTAASSPASVSDVYRIQLASYQNPDGALAGWMLLMADHEDLLAGETPVVQTVERDGGAFYRLLIAGKATIVEARALCDSLTARSVDCLIIRAKGDVAALQ